MSFYLPPRIPMRMVFYILFVTGIITHPTFSQQANGAKTKLHVAVLDFDARTGITPGEAATLSDVLNGEIVKSALFTVVDRNRIKAILSEQGFQSSEACSQVECVVEAGKILKVEKMFVGIVGKIGRMFNINIQIVDVATAQIERNISRTHSGDIEDLVTDIMPDMADQLIKELSGREYKTASSSTWMYYVGGAVLVGGGAAYFLLRPAEATKPPPSQDLPGLPALP